MNDSLAHDLLHEESNSIARKYICSDCGGAISSPDDDCEVCEARAKAAQEENAIKVNNAVHHAMYSVAGMHDFLSANWDNLDLARALVNLCQYCTNSSSANAPAVLHAVERRIYAIAKQEAESCL